MSEKRYIIVSASHHNKSRAFFLSEPFEGKTKPTWRYYLDNALLFTLKQAKKAAGETPIGCYIVEHSQDLLDWFNDGESCKFSRFIEIAQGEDCEIIGDLPQSMQPQPEAEAELNFLPFAENAECIKIALNRLKETESEPREEKRYCVLSEGYIIYRHDFSASAYIYYCGDDVKKLDERDIKNAILFPYVTAAEIAKRLDATTGYTWHVKNKISEPQKETPAPEAKKRTAYALCDYIDGEPSYFCAEYAELYIKRGKENVQVFPTKQDAEFYNAIFMARHPNQAEMYVVEIEY